MNTVYNFLGGRTTAFALAYMVCGIVLAFKHELTPVYITLGTPILALLGKSISDNYHERNRDAGTTPTDQSPSVPTA